MHIFSYQQITLKYSDITAVSKDSSSVSIFNILTEALSFAMSQLKL